MFAVVICLASLSITFAQQDSASKKEKEKEEMNVDLPDETEETDLVQPGQLQIESAFLMNHYKNDKRSYIGQGMVRYGVSERLELRLLVEDGRGRDRYLDKTVQSTYPLAASAKVSLVKDKKGLPDISFVSYVKLPFTSHTSEQKRYWSPIFLAAFQNKLGEKWKLEYNAGVQQEAFGTNWSWLANASLHYKLLQPLEVFVEYYAQYQQLEAPQHNAGGGVAWQINDMLEVYVAGGSTVHYEEPNWFTNGGIAVRFPSKK